MKLSARTRYATRILVELARNTGSTPVAATRISQITGVSVQFVEQILKKLKHAGLTHSTRGASGGHLLAKPPKNVTLGEIVHLMEGGIYITLCSAEEFMNCSKKDSCVTRSAWMKVSKVLKQELDAITLYDLLVVMPGEITQQMAQVNNTNVGNDVKVAKRQIVRKTAKSLLAKIRTASTL